MENIIRSLYSNGLYSNVIQFEEFNISPEIDMILVSSFTNIDYYLYKEKIIKIFNKYFNDKLDNDIIYQFLINIVATNDYDYFYTRYKDILNYLTPENKLYNNFIKLMEHIIKTSFRYFNANIYLISGYLGSGKTTMLKYIEENELFGNNTGFIFNDIPEFNIDAQKFTDKEEINNSCICCTGKSDLLITLYKMYKADNIIIESVGISEPIPVISYLQDNGIIIKNSIVLVDTKYFYTTFIEGKKENYNTNECFKDIEKLLLEQIEGANVIYLTKADLINDNEYNQVYNYVKNINDVLIIKYSKDYDNKKELIKNFKCKFDIKKSFSNPTWIKQITEEKSGNKKSEIDEYNFKTKVYRFKEPINSSELFIEFDDFKKKNNVIRIKGYVVDKLGIALEINESKTTRLLKDITEDYKINGTLIPFTNVAVIYQ